MTTTTPLLLLTSALWIACSGGGDPPSSSSTDPTVEDLGDSGTSDGADGTDGTAELSPGDGCDALVPTYCAFPYPSDFWTVEEADSPTGRRLALTALAMPGDNVVPDTFNEADGFSPSPHILTHLPGATTEGLASSVTIGRSMEPDSPTVIVDLDTGDWVPHWAELDVNTPDLDAQAFLLRPAVGLEPGHRYAVAIRGVVDASGDALSPSEAFAALRDDTVYDDQSVEDRRADFEAMFTALETAGVARGDLQLAWPFTVASTEDTTHDMVVVRDLAEAWSDEPSNLAYTITSVEENPERQPDFALKVEGTFTVPSYRTADAIGTLLSRDDDGEVIQSGTREARFWLLLPRAAAEAPAGIMQYGHGQLGSGSEILWNDEVQQFAAQSNLALLGMDWTGFAVDDTAVVVAALSTGQMHNFRAVPDGLHQAMAEFLVGLRTVAGPLKDDLALQLGDQPPLNPDELYYYGGSQGGIYGSPYMALTPDIERGILAVPGQAYSLMLERSVNFEEYASVLRPSFPGGFDVPMVLSLIQQLWDRAEPSGYSRYIHDPLPGSEAREVMLLVAIGDHQVTTLAAHLMARTIGDVPLLGTPVRELYGIDVVEGTHSGSAMIEYDFGESTEPVENTPAYGGRDPHGRIGEVQAAFDTTLAFLRTGTTQNYCDGACDPD